MVTDLADRGRWCALDSIKAAPRLLKIPLDARTTAYIGRHVHWYLSLRRVLAG